MEATARRGNRARAPSRKSLEATGQFEAEGAQSMTKEKREENMRRRAAQKEERKASAAAGLKLGELLEECSDIAAASPLGAGYQSTTGHNKTSAKGSCSRTESKRARVTQRGTNKAGQQDGLGQAPVYSEAGRDVPMCVFRDCTRPATCGVSGTAVRYW